MMMMMMMHDGLNVNGVSSRLDTGWIVLVVVRYRSVILGTDGHWVVLLFDGAGCGPLTGGARRASSCQVEAMTAI